MSEKKKPRIVNPLSGKKLSREQSTYVRQAREARNTARKHLRSGNPATRAAAVPIYRAGPNIIRALYRQEAAR